MTRSESSAFISDLADLSADPREDLRAEVRPEVHLSTKDRILDQAELDYAEHGLKDFSLRSLTGGAKVNLAAINYHFRSKQILIETMLVRVLRPIYQERLTLLQRLQRQYGSALRPTHVMVALALPSIREIRSGRPAHLMGVMMRASSDTTHPVRGILINYFEPIGRRFDEAFVMAAPHLASDDALWRSRIFINAIAGTICNTNVEAMIGALLAEPGVSVSRALLQLCMLTEYSVLGVTNKDQVAQLITKTLEVLEGTETIRQLK